MAWTERYVSVAGGGAHDGTSEANAWTLAEVIAAPYAAGQRINVKAGTYTNTTTDRTLAVTGSTTAPICWRGYKTTPGDMDGDMSTHGTFASGTDVPFFSFTTGRFIYTGSFHVFQNLDIRGAQVTNAQFRIATGTSGWIDNCRVECTAANANGLAVRTGLIGHTTFTRSWFKATSSAPVMNVDSGASGTTQTITGCTFTGGSHGLTVDTGTSLFIGFNLFTACGGDSMRFTTNSSRVWIIGNTCDTPGSDNIEFAAAPIFALIANNLLTNAGAWQVTNSTGTNTSNITLLSNVCFTNTSGEFNGLSDWPQFGNITEDPDYVGGGDFTPQNTDVQVAYPASIP